QGDGPVRARHRRRAGAAARGRAHPGEPGVPAREGAADGAPAQPRDPAGGGPTSGRGAPELAVDGRGLGVAVVAASWHERVMGGLLAGAERALAAAGAEAVVIRVPGTFELPVVAANVAPTVDAVVALGVVVRGGTPHFDYVCQAATVGLT